MERIKESMKQDRLNEGLKEAVKGFEIEGTFVECKPCGNGHINDTYMLTVEKEGKQQRYSLQHMNRQVFKNPVSLMQNILKVTDYLKEEITKQGGQPQRETLDFVRSKDGKPYFIDSFGEYWRAYHFIEGAYAPQENCSPQDFYESAVAFGRFQKMLSGFPADSLEETIAGFHDTKARFAAFEKAVEEDGCQRAAGVEEEIRFVKERYDVACGLGELLEKGELPLRVTHNDTKSNNVLIDEETGKGLCVIDLDTVMPGLAVNDFGDSIRFGASTAEEDEKDLSKVSCDLELYDLYTKGFIEGCGGTLTPMEIKCLPLGAKVMTYECGMRFLADYLAGDVYFKTDYPTHNLDRARTQFKLVADMEEKWQDIEAIISKYL